ncbi:hypothetical protein ACGFZL_12520 [Streptomyces sp. NPDC048182]|uniref:hypothetical protein n=1 Tax=Streptomyces sp. NPDC048182 TaxID=3365507 RepID=UPI003718DC3E
MAVGEWTPAGGSLTQPEPEGHAVRWNADGRSTALPTLGSAHASAEDVNDAGVAVGTAERADGTPRAVRWSADGTVSELGALDGDVKSRAWAVNGSGAAVGESENAAGHAHAVLWRPDGTVVDLGALARSLPAP